MQMRAIKEGQRYRISVRGHKFTATVEKKCPGLVKLADHKPRVTYIFVSPRRVEGEA